MEMHRERPPASRSLRTGQHRESASVLHRAAMGQTAIERKEDLALRGALAQRTTVEDTGYRMRIEPGGEERWSVSGHKRYWIRRIFKLPPCARHFWEMC